MNIAKRLILFIAVLSGTFAVALPALPVYAGPFDASKQQACRGANLSNNDTGCDGTTARQTLDKRIGFIVNLLTVLVGIIAVIVIIVNGIRFITSNGDSNSISSAKHGIIYAIVGLIVVALAQVIVRFVLSRIN